MNISLNWLTEYVDVSLPAAELGELFTNIGLNCDGIDETGSDIVYDLEVTSNRPDWLGHLGVARELATATSKKFQPPAVKLPAGQGQIADVTSVDVQAPDLCPRYTARVIKNVKVGPSPQWMIDYLEAVGMRSVNNIVDITNFVLMEYAQPLHSFDYDKLAEGRIVVRRALPGETLVSIDETTCKLTPDMLVIADAKKAVAIAGIMGGLDTEVTNETTTILLEAAQFDPLTTRKTSRALGLMSESNYRFERGVDPVALDEASQRACALICELAGGQMVEGLADVWATPYQAPQVTLRPERTAKLLGINVPVERQVEILAGLGLEPKLDGEKIACTIPSFRADLTREADLIEEVARMVGYDKITLLSKVAHPVRPMGLFERIRREAIHTLTASGYSEAITFSFIDAEEATLFGFDNVICVDKKVRRTNNALRPTLLPSLLRACKSNQAVGNPSVSLFEIAAVFPAGTDKESLPEEYIQLALVSTEGLQDVRGCLAATVNRIAPQTKLEVKPADSAGLAEGVAAVVLLDGEEVGQIGLVSAAVLKHYGLEKSIAAATLKLPALIERANLTRTAHLLPKFPPINRDLSLVIDEDVTWGELIKVVHSVAQPLRVAEKYVTTYRGKQVPAGKKSVTMNLEYRSAEETLTGQQVDQQIEELLTPLKAKFAAELRA